MKRISFISHALVFADEDKNRAAALLPFILVSTSIANIIAILARPFLLADQTSGWVSANIVILLLQIGLFILVRKGHIRLAGFLVTALLWLIVSLEAYTNNGILNPLFAIQMIVGVIAALLINEWAALGFAVLSSVFGLWLVQLAETGKYIKLIGVISTQQTWLNDTTAFLLVAFLFYLRIRTIRELEKRAVEQTRSRQHSDERYRSLVENAPDTIFTLDRDHRITYLSRSPLGPVETFIGRSVYDLLHPDSRDAYRAAVNRVFELGSTEQIEVQNLRPDEESSWYSVRFAPVLESGKVVEVTAISTDITEQKRAQAAVRAGEERYHRALDSLLEGAQIIGFDWRYLYVNNTVVAQGRKSRESLLASTMTELYPGIENTEMFAVLRICMEQRTAQRIVNEFAYPDGTKSWFELSIQPIPEGIFILSLDITERKQAEAALHASEEQYRQLFAANPQPMFVTDLETLRLLAVNDAAVNHYGYSREEFLTMTAADLRAEEPSVVMKQASELRQQQVSRQSDAIVQHRKKDGSFIWVEMAFHRLNYNGRDAVVSAAHDLTERLKAEEALRASEEQYRQLFEANPHPMVVTDIETGSFLAVNDAAIAKYGYSRDAFLNMTNKDLRLPEDNAAAADVIKRYEQEKLGYVSLGVWRHVKQDGSLLYVELTVNRLPYNDRNAVLMAFYDITERLEAEQAVRESEARLRARIESAMDAIITIDEQQNIVQFNPAAEKMFRVSADRIMGQPIIKLIPERFREGHSGHIRAFGQTGVTNRRMGALGAISGLRANGEEFPIEASISQFDVGTGKFYSVILRDITERKRAEDEIRRSEELFSTIFQSVPIAIGIVSLVTNQTLAVNEYTLKLTGYETNEIIGRPIAEAPYWIRDDQWQQLSQPIRDGESTSGVEMEWQTQSGERLTMLGSAIQVDIHGEPCLLGLALDITERKHAERIRLEVYKERELVEVKERFISRMSHDFRTPLSVVLTANELLRRYYDRMTHERREEHFQNIENQVRFATNLLDDVLTLSKEQAGKMPFNPAPINLVSTCEGLFLQMQITDNVHHEFIFVTDGEIGAIQGDEKLLQHIIINLLSNAIKYSPKESEIRFEVRREGDSAVIQISDQGIGIPQEDQQHLFEPFYRASNTGSINGTGLGLAIVKESVETHQGTIHCESALGQGTTFVIHLPIVPQG